MIFSLPTISVSPTEIAKDAEQIIRDAHNNRTNFFIYLLLLNPIKNMLNISNTLKICKCLLNCGHKICIKGKEITIMNETQNEKELQSPEAQTITPEKTDNVKSEISDNLNDSAKPKEGQSEKEKDPSAELILGKFKSVEELSKAYEELQKHQGKCSEELGSLRKELANFNDCKNLAESLENYRNAITSVVARDKELYDTPEYLQNPIFKEIYSEALMTYGDNLDTDRLIGLLEKYVENRKEST